MTIDALNAMTPDEFTEALGWIFERSPWVACGAAAQRPFGNMDALHRAMVRQVESASAEEQLSLLRAHPDLGTRLKLSDASGSEQAGAGLDRLTPDELERFSVLNESYKAKFGFPFLFAVKGSTKHDILRALEARLYAKREEEYAEALRQVYRIAAFRLAGCIDQEK